MKNSTKPICGAKAKQTGKPCEKAPLKGKTRCRLHGGKTPSSQNAGASNRNHKHGLYTVGLSDEEQALWTEMKLGSVDDELRLCRIQLNRAMILEADITKPPAANGMELAEIRESFGGEEGSSRTDRVLRKPDVHGRMNWLVGRIGMLEKVRAELIAAAGEKTEDKLPLPWED